ncbi:MAG: gamma-glutamyltransferase family protein [Gemmatimonadales bacterium]|nr:MAG: gamma-glutamyltransferase family protein [Gemmatimonadales bacterium]
MSDVPRTLPASLLTILAILVACEPADAPPSPATDAVLTYELPVAPEIGTGYTEKPGWEAESHMATAAHPLAVDAGFQVLEAGGSAVDAAIAMQMVLTLVEPQSSGIGGGAFLMHFDGEAVTAFDGRETAPAEADESLFLDADGEPIPFGDAVRSGLSVGTPGTIAMLRQAHARHGRLAWDELFRPAITLSEEGFEVSPRLNALLEGDEALRRDALAGAFYYDEAGDPWPVGHRLRNPALAEVLARVANEGPDAFYHGEVAEDIVYRVRSHPERPGLLSVEDLAEYLQQDTEVDPLCSDWAEWRLCGFPPPSSGHLAVAQILGILAAVPGGDAPLADDGLPDPDWMHLYSEASRLAYADRERFVADARFVDAPGDDWSTLLDPDYLAARAELIGERSMGEAEAGDPAPVEVAFGRHPVQTESGTSHLSVVDLYGNAVSMTMTIESGFGARIMSDGGTELAGGFLLNNELTDFSRVPVDAMGLPIANRVEGGKRPRSSMAPTLVFDRESGEFVAATGSPGGAAIIHYTAKSLLGMLSWGLSPQEAANLPNFAAYNSPATVLERDRFPATFREVLEARGHDVAEQALTSGIHAILRVPDGWQAGADPRREGWGMGR